MFHSEYLKHDGIWKRLSELSDKLQYIENHYATTSALRLTEQVIETWANRDLVKPHNDDFHKLQKQIDDLKDKINNLGKEKCPSCGQLIPSS